MEIIDWIVDIYIVIFWAVIIIGNIVRGVLWIKCSKIIRCSNKKCPFKQFCEKYHEDWDKEALESFLQTGFAEQNSKSKDRGTTR